MHCAKSQHCRHPKWMVFISAGWSCVISTLFRSIGARIFIDWLHSAVRPPLASVLIRSDTLQLPFICTDGRQQDA